MGSTKIQIHQKAPEFKRRCLFESGGEPLDKKEGNLMLQFPNVKL